MEINGTLVVRFGIWVRRAEPSPTFEDSAELNALER